MLTTFATGFLLGLGGSALCMATCAPLAFAVMVERPPGPAAGPLKALLLFLAGRLIGYLVIGAAVGAAGAAAGVALAGSGSPPGMAAGAGIPSRADAGAGEGAGARGESGRTPGAGSGTAAGARGAQGRLPDGAKSGSGSSAASEAAGGTETGTSAGTGARSAADVGAGAAADTGAGAARDAEAGGAPGAEDGSPAAGRTGAALRIASAAAMLLVAAAMWLSAAGWSAPEGGWLCRFAMSGRRLAAWPAAMGALTGLQLCPPILGAVITAASKGSIATGIAHFAGFYAGSSLPLALLALWPAVGRRFGESALLRIRSGSAMAAGFMFFCWGLTAFFPRAGEAVLNVAEADLREVLPGATVFSAAHDPPRFLGFASPGDRVPIGACFVTSQAAPAESFGYGGPVPVLVGLDREGRITGLKLLPHNETPIYVERVEDPRYLESYKGRRVTDPLVLGGDIQAITGATVTAEAICAGIREGGRRVARESFGVDMEGARMRAAAAGWAGAVLRLRVLVPAAFMIAAAMAALVWKEDRRIRDATLVASIIIMGLAFMEFFSIGHVLAVATWSWPRLPANITWYVPLAGAAALALLMGGLYCDRICPFGALTELAGRLWPWRLPLSPGVSRVLSSARFVVLLGSVAAYIVWRGSGVAALEPFSPAFSLLSLRGWPDDILPACLLGLVAVLCLFRRRFWCRHLCPAGAALDVAAKFRLSGAVGVSPEAGGDMPGDGTGGTAAAVAPALNGPTPDRKPDAP
ncbi:MAG: 4Fe-4S binding protein [Planctomycetota bacterium]|nr:4Fe-4S binding protein [Planctomycetota bacterium]